MKVILPEDSRDITLGQFQEYVKCLHDEDIDKKKLEIFAGIPEGVTLTQKDYKEMLEQIDKALNTEALFVDRFTLGKIEFGFIPNFDKIGTDEFVDIKSYEPVTNEAGDIENVEDLNKLMAILFRPIVKTNLTKDYNIASYNGTSEFAEQMKEMPMNIVNGALFFFTLLAESLQRSIQRFTQEAQAMDKKQATTLVNGDGMLL